MEPVEGDQGEINAKSQAVTKYHTKKDVVSCLAILVCSHCLFFELANHTPAIGYCYVSKHRFVAITNKGY